MNRFNLWGLWIFGLITGPILFGLATEFAISRSHPELHDWKLGIAVFGMSAVICLLLFVVSLGVRYLFRRFGSPN